ncbi:MAG: acetyl-CoA carboxylase biotin carboxylase subunit, partial [Myxococcota bacterium]
SGEAALPVAREVGFPVMLKAASGGGGKGMRLVHDESDFIQSFNSCSREALSAFGDGSVYIERAIIKPRHIEIQVLADSHGNAVHVFERECSVQRRHQKVIEEAPAANLSDETRRQMGEVAVRAAKAINYCGAGTCEFMVDAEENFYFLEMNTRLQVEHPVTEEISGLDLVKEMIRIAAGAPLSFSQDDLVRRGHAIECRLYAEDPYQNFLPSPGKLTRYEPPSGPGIRVDDGVDEGDEVTPHYDPMIAKIICWADTRDAAIERMLAALKQLRIGGIKTNRGLLEVTLQCAPFRAGRYDTGLLGTMMPLEEPALTDEAAALIAAVAAVRATRATNKPSAASGSTVATGSGWRRAGRAESVRSWGM